MTQASRPDYDDQSDDALWMLVVHCSNVDEAKPIARALVERGLAKCVNIAAPMESVYVWEGKIEEESELRLTAKLPKARLDGAVALVRSLHSFDVPAIYGWPVAFASAEYRAYHVEKEAQDDR